MKTIRFRIDKKGEVHIDVEGVADATCEQLTKAFESALGGEISDVQRKPNYYVELDELTQSLYEDDK
jgi:imidazoleglycerol phosphate dehydratase HisB